MSRIQFLADEIEHLKGVQHALNCAVCVAMVALKDNPRFLLALETSIEAGKATLLASHVSDRSIQAYETCAETLLRSLKQ